MDAFVNEKDFERIAKDPYTFSVLDRILRSECELIRTDHCSLILCHSEKPYPVWIWTPDGINEEEKARAWNLAAEARPLREGYRFNMKYELADYFIARSREIGLNVGFLMRLYAYSCPSPIAPEHPADGELYRCTEADLEEAAALFSQFNIEIGEEPPSRERCLEKAQDAISRQAFHFWKNSSGKTAACCSFRINNGLATLGPVYTFPEERRKHYAQQLVWQITKKVKAMGYMPALYTDADYAASNACYEKIGYKLRGRLCTIAAMQNNQ